MRWVEYVVLMGVVTLHTKFRLQTQKRLNSLRELDPDRKIKTDLKSSVRMWIGLIWLKMGDYWRAPNRPSDSP